MGMLQNGPVEVGNDILLPNGPTLVLQGSPLPVLGSPYPPREKRLSMPEIGEKERDYLFIKTE